MLKSALNKSNKSPIIADRIEVVELEMGTQASPLPTLVVVAFELNDFHSHLELEVRDIGKLTQDSLEEYSDSTILAMLL